MQSRRGNVLDASFWSGFAKKFWEKKPVVLRQIRSSITSLDQDEVFRLLVLYSDICRRRNDSEGFKFYVDGIALHEQEVLDFLPLKSDRSLERYHERMNDIFSDYCLVCDELLQVTKEKRGLLLDFTEGLYRQVGFPNRFSEMGLYLGNYRKTPFGVHVDGCGVFSFPVVGSKKFRVWEGAFGKRHPELDRAFRYDKFKKNSQLLTVKPGDMAYWPSSAWHIAESDGSFSVTWSLGVWVDRPHRDVVTEALADFFAAILGADAELTTTPIRETHLVDGEILLPSLYRESLKKIRKASAQELERSLLAFWSSHVSKQGLKNKRPLTKEPKLKASSLIRIRDPRSPILWSRSERDVFLSFAGSSATLKGQTNSLKLIRSLNGGKICRLGDFFGGGERASSEIKSLQVLADAGAFDLA